jgi:hypothetical protein
MATISVSMGRRKLSVTVKFLSHGWYVEGLIVFELEQVGEAGWGLISEIEADGGLFEFGFAGRLEMNVDDEVFARVETPGHAVGLAGCGKTPDFSKICNPALCRIQGESSLNYFQVCKCL